MGDVYYGRFTQIFSTNAPHARERRSTKGATNPPEDARRLAQAVAMKDAAKRLKFTIL